MDRTITYLATKRGKPIIKKRNQIRIYHGPVNVGGIGRFLADWQRKQGALSDFIVWYDFSSRKNNHRNLHIDACNSVFQKYRILLKNFFSSVKNYQIFHFYFGKSLLPYNVDLPVLKFLGKKTIMTYCGSDIRLVEVDKKRNPYWKLINSHHNSNKYDRKKKWMMFWQNLWIDRFYAVRELYEYAVQVISKSKIIKDFWINNVILDFSSPLPVIKTKKIPVLVHAPSNPGIKGSKFVEEAISNLRKKGYKFDYIRLEKIPNREANLIYRDKADIIIDQFIVGGFGSLAIEGMFHGKPVCCYLIDDFFKWYPDCPIVNCNIDNLEEKLAWLIEHPDERIKIGKRGRKFVEKHANPEKINKKVWDLYKKLVQDYKNAVL